MMNVPMSLAVVAALLIATDSVQAEMSSSEFVDLYQRADPADKLAYENMASATENGMSWYKTASKIDLYCEPQNMPLTGNQIMEILKRQSARNPDIASSPWGYGLLKAMRLTFPCTEQKK